jgi:DNA replication protein
MRRKKMLERASFSFSRYNHVTEFFMKWYQQKYVSHRDWILDNLDKLGMSPQETVIVMLIDFMNEHDMTVTLPDLMQKTGMTSDEVNSVISVLCSKKYLDIKAGSGSIRWVLDGLFETDTARETLVTDRSLVELFEEEFGRPLSPNEMEKINEWNRDNEKKLIIFALREASAYGRLNFPYIDKILYTWKEKGITADKIESELEKE